ncbi:putative serine protease K12H4.7 [Pectinophora gossypiella]|uniref:putative serine protease K12H4.7 n=1 Tax=Pectinophora gossypiella TaxID=13191 RepID=UPI00214F0825|nr:putative serine protease K12H4.7 [Pectinophora gossypiella]
MHLTNTVLLLNFAGIYGFRFYSFGNGYRYLSKQMANYAVQFDYASVDTKWIEQPLDHFDAKENRPWKMRYFENLEFWKPNGTIYLFIGGEGEAHPYFLTLGTLYELANETNGAMFGSEHRYYGKSMPLDNTVTENLKYLSSRQALADLAYLLETIRSSPKFKKSTSSKVVVIGGSYPGNLAAWMRLLYPNLVDAAIASSAPVLAKKDFFEYLETVSDDYEQQGLDGCHDKISEIFKRYEKLFSSEQGIKQLKEEEKICQDNDMTRLENKQLFFMDKTSEFMGRAQYGNPDYIKKHCAKIMNSSRIATSKMSFEDEPNFWREEIDCYDYDFYNMIDEMKEIDWILSWIYQTCTEFGYYQSTNSDNHPFTRNIPAELYYKMCTGLFGPEFEEQRIDEGIDYTNKLYGGLSPNVTNVVFVNGDMDPWSRLGILEDVSYDAPAKVIPRASHCRDLFSNRKGDPEELVEARSYIKYLIKKWLRLGEYYKLV